MTQSEFAEYLRVDRSVYAAVENGSRMPSRAFMDAAYERGFSVDWLLHGVGEAPVVAGAPRAARDRLPDWGRDAKLAGMLGVPAPRPVPIAKAGIRDGVLQQPKAGVEPDERGASDAGTSERSRFGYAERATPDDLRAHAALDSEIRGTNFERLIMDDAFWTKIQPVTGRELELLRVFCAKAGDPPLLHYVVSLEFLRTAMTKDG